MRGLGLRPSLYATQKLPWFSLTEASYAKDVTCNSSPNKHMSRSPPRVSLSLLLNRVLILREEVLSVQSLHAVVSPTAR